MKHSNYLDVQKMSLLVQMVNVSILIIDVIKLSTVETKVMNKIVNYWFWIMDTTNTSPLLL